ncbi:MAG TPA: DJ-1/PfpI family protein, partial [Victivallales bacterium]|nr:DJ-1/PfpI family protein [Victivallales bacterium]
MNFLFKCFVFMFTLYNTLLISSEEQNPPVQKNKYNALMIIAENNFRDEELLIPKKILEENNIKVIISSTTIQTVTGMLKAKIKPDILLNDVNASDYDAIIFVGGIGAKS